MDFALRSPHSIEESYGREMKRIKIACDTLVPSPTSLVPSIDRFFMQKLTKAQARGKKC